MTRPANLPSFGAPPLNEVVVGVQYAPVSGYSQIHSGDVWSLFKDKFPIVEEHQALAPTLENFSLPRQAGIEMITGAMHDRFWFLTEDKCELIQFQPDKFIRNWRKQSDEKNEYPRFESIIENFTKDIEKLEAYYKESFEQPSLSINHCEVSYINFLYLNDLPDLGLNQIFSFLNFDTEPPGLVCEFNEPILNDEGQPIARMNTSVSQATGVKGRMYRLSISIKGSPEKDDIKNSLIFIENARIKIVNHFKNITSPEAHKFWRIKE